ncbi:MAG TPA: hypothetical protein VHU90_00365 [Galbitalea sp.]|nr:hypothetical protein [Galbitalea sp.]
MKTNYEFTLPRGYVDPYGNVHRVGRMRLATARDELEPLRDPSVTGPDDPRLTILVLARVVEKLGELGWVSDEHIEGLFAVDLAFLQDFYGVINFGTQQEFDALMAAQQGQSLVNHADDVEPQPAEHEDSDEDEGLTDELSEEGFAADEAEGDEADFDPRPVLTRPSVEELPSVAQ